MQDCTVLDKLDEIIYEPENLGEDEMGYTGRDFIYIAEGNVQYAESLYQRVTWQSPRTLMAEDQMTREIAYLNGQFIMTDGNHDLAEKLEEIEYELKKNSYI